MFQIGSSLQEARLRQGIELPQAERDTRIRSKYLAALEDERFDILPGDAYAKGFLRTYAEFLGLDGELYVEEFRNRYESSEQPAAPPPVHVRTASRRRAVVVGAVAAVLGLLALAGILAGRVDETGDKGSAAPSSRVPTGTPAAHTTPAPRRRPPTTSARLRLTAERGDCWLSVRAGGPTGRVLFEGTLGAGESRVFEAKRLWLRVGAPWNLEAKLNGKPIGELAPDTGNVVVTPSGPRPA